MQKKFKNGWLCFVGILALIASGLSAKAAMPYDTAVKVSATISASPARVTLNWNANSGASGYNISRKAINSSTWTAVANVGATTLTWTDSNVAAGQAYEYQIIAPGSGATGYIYAGVNANMVESRGRVLLVVDNTYAAQLASELARLEQDLVGDGWTVVRR